MRARLLVVMLALAGCSAPVAYEVAATKPLPDTSSITIGVPYDVAGIGLDAGGHQPEGFAVQLGTRIAAGLGLADDAIEWTPVEPSTVKTQLTDESVDVAIATYTAGQAKNDGVTVAGAYYLAGQDILIRSDADAELPDDLDGKRVCTRIASAAPDRLARAFPEIVPVTEPTLEHCLARLLSGSAEGVSADAPLLLAHVAESDGALRLLGRPFTRESYVVAVRPDEALASAVGDVLQQARADGTWQAAYEVTLGKSGIEPMTAENWPPPIPSLASRKIGRPTIR